MVRKEGPQLSLIDLPGVTHNSDEMKDIHEAGKSPCRYLWDIVGVYKIGVTPK